MKREIPLLELNTMLPIQAVKSLAARMEKHATVLSTDGNADAYLTDDDLDALLIPLTPRKAIYAMTRDEGEVAAEAYVVTLEEAVGILVIVSSPDEFHCFVTSDGAWASHVITTFCSSFPSDGWLQLADPNDFQTDTL